MNNETQITGPQSFHRTIQKEGEERDVLVDLRKPISIDNDQSIMLQHPDGGVGYGDDAPAVIAADSDHFTSDALN